MPKMTKYQLEHFEKKVERTLNPLIEDQELLVKQYTTEATNKASKKLAVKNANSSPKISSKFL
jgi:hypothetical protein